MEPQALKIWRGTLLFITAAECCVQAGSAYWQARFRPESVAGLYGLCARSLAVTVVVVAVTLLALYRFLGPRASLASGLVALAGMKIAGETFAAVFTVHRQDFYQGGAMLAGVVMGEAYARRAGVRPENSRAEALEARRFGMTGALGMLAGSYMAAGTSKLLAGGFGWATSSALRLMLLSHAEVDGGAWSLVVPRWTAASPLVCMALETGTLIIQLGAFMLVLGPRARRLWATLIVAFHAGIYLTSHILFLTPMIFAIAVAVPWSRVLRRAEDPEDPGEAKQDLARPVTRPGALVLIVVGCAALLRLTSGH
ncbi:MAG: hypothetical protein WCJ30_24695 [Deltaproteobacteria bacterium]